MAEYIITEKSNIVAIADAVRSGTNTTEEMTLSEIATGVSGIGTNIVVDPTLTQEGQAADAKVVGDAINEVNADISTIMNMLIELDVAPVVTDVDGSVLAESDGAILVNL